MKYVAFVLLGVLLPIALYGADLPVDGGQDSGAMIEARIKAMVVAGVPPEMARKTVQAMTQVHFSAEQFEAVRQVIRAAQRQGLPTEALAAKLLEGLAKKATPDMTVRAMTHVAARYGYAYSEAQRLTSDDRQRIVLGDIMAAGLAAGLTRENMTLIMDRLESRARQIKTEQGLRLAEETLLIARDMARQGIAPKDVVEVISRALARGYSAEAVHQARQAMIGQRASLHPDALARGYAQALGQGGHGVVGGHGSGQSSAAGQGAGAAGSGGEGGGGSAGGSGGGSGGGAGGGGAGR
ncbi:MAG: hypothetical protein V2L15_09850 [Desulfobacteraceae bacterium]|jgi:hypothetical protein|nr:hypothetical protein [Desulfobacteraceae bacterium]